MSQTADGPRPGALTRGAVLRAGAVATGGAAAGVLIGGGLPGRAAQSDAAKDAEILNFALQLERMQAAFYADALKRGKLTGELREYATVVGGHEQEHVKFLESALAGAAKPAQKYDFGEDTSSPEAFQVAAQRMEDLSAQAYNAAAPGLSTKALRAAAKIASVEARHAAWIRDLAGENPAPDAAEPVTTAAKVASAVQQTGYVV